MAYDPLVSIIITSLNRDTFIRKTINSALEQSYKNVEVIVVDGNSTDGTVDILKSYGDRIRWISEEDKGETDANNKGVRLSEGEILCFLPSDDMLTQDAVEVAVQTFRESEENVAMVNGDGFMVDEEDYIIGFLRSVPFTVDFLMNRNPGRIIMSSTFLKKSAVQEVGVWDTKIWYASDFDLWVRILKKYEARYVQHPLSYRRRHNDSLTVCRRVPSLWEGFRIRRYHGGKLFSPASYQEFKALLKHFLPRL